MKTKVFAYLAGFLLCFVLALPLLVSAQGIPITSELANTGSGIYGEGNVPTETNLPKMIGNLINVFLSFMGVVLVILIIFGGWKYMMSQGDTKKTESGKNMIVEAIIGLIIILAAYAIANFVISRLATATGTTTQ